MTDIKQWRYIETEHSPADLITRKRLNMNLANEKFWWEGSFFLKKGEEFIGKINYNEFRFRDSGVLEIKNRSAVNLAKTDFTNQVNLQEIIDIERFGSFQKLELIFSWVFRFFNNLKQKLLRKPMLLKEILDKKELNLSEEILILDNQNKFETDSQSFRNLKNDLNIIKENNIFKGKVRLENAPIPIEAKLPILIYREHY